MADADILAIWNQALQLIGTKSTVLALAEDSNEAVNCNVAYAPLRDWALTLTNWNFARKTAVLALLRTVNVTPPWTVASPAPGWIYSYTFPSDCIIVRYVTDMSLDSGSTKYAGMPARFAVVWDTTAAGRAILTDKVNAIATYTWQTTDPSKWPAYFQKLVAAHLAVAIAPALSGNMDVLKFVSGLAELFTTLAVETNLREGLFIEDTTPEWIIARGIPYPQRRAQVGQGQQQQPQGPSDGNKR